MTLWSLWSFSSNGVQIWGEMRSIFASNLWESLGQMCICCQIMFSAVKKYYHHSISQESGIFASENVSLKSYNVTLKDEPLFSVTQPNKRGRGWKLHADAVFFFLALNVVVFRWFRKAVSVVSIPQNFTIQSLISKSLNLTRKAIAHSECKL